MISLNEVVTHEVVEAAFAGTTLCKWHDNIKPG